jgi:hypothetical protein
LEKKMVDRSCCWRRRWWIELLLEIVRRKGARLGFIGRGEGEVYGGSDGGNSR